LPTFFQRIGKRLANFTKDLAMRAIVFVKVWLGRIATEAFAIIGQVTIGSSGDRFDGYAIPLLIEVQKQLVINGFIFFESGYLGKFVYFEFLIFKGMRIIECPLSQRNIFCDKKYQPTNLLAAVKSKNNSH